MKTTKILESEISGLKISSLPTRPNSPTNFGGAGYTSIEMKEAFDKLPLFIIERFNSLIDDISGESDEPISTSIQTGIMSNHSLDNLFRDIISGAAANYITVFGESLAAYLGKMRKDIDVLNAIVK